MFAAARVIAENSPRRMARGVALTPESPLRAASAAKSPPPERRPKG
jgi:hypothetical protein